MTQETPVERPTIAAPPPFGHLLLPKGAWLTDIEESADPFFVATEMGWYAAKTGLYARSIIPMKGMPPGFADLEGSEKRGFIKLTGVRFPLWLVLQAKDFFTRIYEKHHTEAEICITYNWEENRFRAFVPEQYVGHGGVHYKFNPEHISKGWNVVGTIHSHCNFGAFHSGTDTHDADHQDGMHMTIGKLESGVEYAQMLSIGPTRIDLDFDEAVDIDQKDGPNTAPGWWDRHVHPHGQAPWSQSARQTPANNWNNYSGTYFKTPDGYRSVYDPYDNKTREPARRFITPNKWQTQDGRMIITPAILPTDCANWYEWIRKIGADPRTYLFNEENFPDYFNKVPNGTQFYLTAHEMQEMLEERGIEYRTFSERKVVGAEEEDEDERIKRHRAQDKANKAKKRNKKVTNVTYDKDIFEGWWAYIIQQAETNGTSVEDVQKGMAETGIVVDPENKSVTYEGQYQGALGDVDVEDDEDWLRRQLEYASDDEEYYSETVDTLMFMKKEMDEMGFSLDWQIVRKNDPQQLLLKGI